MKNLSISLLTACCLILSLAAASLNAAPIPVNAPDLQVQQHQQVEDLYAKMLTYTGSTDLDLQVSGLVTGDSSLFSSFLWVDVVTMPGGDSVAMHRLSDATANTASYSASWEHIPANWEDSPDGQIYSAYTIQQVLDGTVGQSAVVDLSNAHSATAYTVTATLDGQSRTYSALFVWYPNADGDLEYVVSDNIVAGIAEVAIEDLPPTAQAFAGAQKSDRPDTEPHGDTTTTTGDGGTTTTGGDVVTKPIDPVPGGECTPSTVQVGPFNNTDEATNDHISGKHYAYATLGATCTCDASCQGTCRASVTNTRCWDSGWTGWCHKMTSDSSASINSKHGGGASCAAGFSCSETHTWFCLGVKKIKVKIEGVEVEFEDDGGSDWSVTWPFSTTCGPCEAR